MRKETTDRQACSPLIQLFFRFASDIDHTNINIDIRDGNWLSTRNPGIVILTARSSSLKGRFVFLS